MTAYDPAAEALRARFRREEAALHAEGFVTVAEAMEGLGVSRNAVNRMIGDGRLQAVRWEHRWVTRPEWIDEVPRRGDVGMLTVTEAAAQAGVHRETVRLAIRDRRLRAAAPTPGRGYAIDPDDFAAWEPRRPRLGPVARTAAAKAWRRANGWLSVTEAAELLGITSQALSGRIRKGQQTAVRADDDAPTPGAWLIHVEDVVRRGAPHPLRRGAAADRHPTHC